METQLLQEITEDFTYEQVEMMMSGNFQHNGQDVFLATQTDNSDLYVSQNLTNDSNADILWTNPELPVEIVEQYGLEKIEDSYVNGAGAYYRGSNEDLLEFVRSLDSDE